MIGLGIYIFCLRVHICVMQNRRKYDYRHIKCCSALRLYMRVLQLHVCTFKLCKYLTRRRHVGTELSSARWVSPTMGGGLTVLCIFSFFFFSRHLCYNYSPSTSDCWSQVLQLTVTEAFNSHPKKIYIYPPIITSLSTSINTT